MWRYQKPGCYKRLRRRHHTQRIIEKRAELSYQLGYTPWTIDWHPYQVCLYPSNGIHRIYHAMGMPCPCYKHWSVRKVFRNGKWEEKISGTGDWGLQSKQKNKSTRALSKVHTCSHWRCKRSARGKSKKERLAEILDREVCEYAAEG